MLPDVHRRIVNAKYVLERAKAVQLQGGEMSSSIALLLTHDAIELLMLAVLDHADAKSSAKRAFMDFWPDMKAATGSEPPDRLPIEALNKLRVGLKHNGNQPHEKTLEELLHRSQGFFENILSRYCDLLYSEVSMLQMIEDEEVIALLKRAKEQFCAGDHSSALLNLRFAFEKINQPEGRYLPLLTVPELPTLARELRDAGFERYFKQIHEFLNQSALRANTSLLHVDPIPYLAFKRLGPYIQWSWSGVAQAVRTGRKMELTPEQFQFWFDFLVDYAWKAQAAYINLPTNEVTVTRPKREYFLRTGPQQ